jgi:hypothetical protein
MRKPREVGRKLGARLGLPALTLLPAGFEPLVGGCYRRRLSRPSESGWREGSLFEPIHAIVCLRLRCERPLDCLEPNAAPHRGSKPAQTVKEGQPNLGRAEFFSLPIWFPDAHYRPTPFRDSTGL